ncbi:DUF1365 domain-containing protein [Nocardia sp. NPDC059180]|uniref:DUF1365 domain-containing protein n=1 Tax=Nocardia sp. NPDC059180 TaxID=3346761 RepID=UPI0036ACF383
MVPSSAALYLTRIHHARAAPVRHSFEYRGYSWFFDVDAPPRLPRLLRPLGYFRPEDHLDGPADNLRDRVIGLLEDRGIDSRIGRINALMSARVLGYVFDPLTVFWCHGIDGSSNCVVAEVHNTYGQRHAYILHPDDEGYAEVDKQFYVSPFHDLEGRYYLRLPEPAETLAIRITLQRADQPPFRAVMTGHPIPVTPRNLLRAHVRTPFAPWLTAARIRRQGMALWARGVPLRPRPHINSSPRTTS